MNEHSYLEFLLSRKQHFLHISNLITEKNKTSPLKDDILEIDRIINKYIEKGVFNWDDVANMTQLIHGTETNPIFDTQS